MSKKDWYIAGVITLIFAFLVFYRIGSFNAPITAYTATAENSDIVLDFGVPVSLSHLYIFLGPLDNRTFSISLFDLDKDKWELLDGEVYASAVFSWNRINVPYELRYLGLVAMKGETIINEIVAVAEDGSVIIPYNASDYPELFDEQEIFSPLYSATYWGGTMFDEIYHGRSAYEYIHGLKTYETTHPPLGKTLISYGVRLFGMNPFGWRFASAVFGILMVPLFYLFGIALFKNTFAATSVTILIAADCMHFALSRIATIDIFAAFFILLMYYLMLRFVQTNNHGYRHMLTLTIPNRKPISITASHSRVLLGLCGITMGLGIATKWTAIYAGAGLGLIFLWYMINHPPTKFSKLFFFCTAFFGFIPLLIYIVSYRHFVPGNPGGGLFKTIIENTVHMFSYHSELEASHYYSTPFFDWPTLHMPLLYATDPVRDNLMSSVNCMGNPAIWWFGIPCLLFCIYRFLLKEDLRAGFLVAAYLAQYLPWGLISRITFIYHYFPASLFLILMIGYVLNMLAKYQPWGKKVAYCYLVFAVIVFFVFYPVISGIPSDRDYQFSLRWLNEWILVL
ncbi:MAG: phospholipid carrier-dependent glycosyltransferase [Lachnospiraceae bacterium]|nr:phospholipid carrier-dependent glycosyltransferase [Lachnospiraceae bacterium]